VREGRQTSGESVAKHLMAVKQFERYGGHLRRKGVWTRRTL
jgi:hypothetical protein